MIHLSQKEIEAIERVISKEGRTEAIVKVENGKVIVIQVERKRIA